MPRVILPGDEGYSSLSQHESVHAHAHSSLTGIGANDHHAPSVTEILIPATELFVIQGSPVLVNAGSGADTYRVWNMPDSSTTSVGCYTLKPSGWNSFNLEFLWTIPATATTTWRWAALHADNIQTGNFNKSSGGLGGDLNLTGLAAHSYNRRQCFSTSSYFGKAQIVREGAHANDTFTGAIYIVGVILSKAS